MSGREAQARSWEPLAEQRCPVCRALLMKAKGDGVFEVKCPKCGHLVRRHISRT